jgi:bacillithiol biosynthesis cysteine-adding enzyme BshC
MLIPAGQLPHLPRLVEDYFSDYGKVADYFNGDFRERKDFERQAARVRARSVPRQELTEVLTEQNKTYGCGPETLELIEQIARDQACAVVTGQQVGLFSGPLYTIYKALTAVKLAESLSRHGLGRVVPIFWMASDDHDLAEIDHIALPDMDNRPQTIRCPMPLAESPVPAGNRILSSDIRDCLRRLGDLTRNSEFKAEVIGSLSDDYQPGRSFVEAFARWMTRLFKRQGLILIDAAHPRLKELGSGVFHREIADQSPSTRQAVAVSERLRQAGYDSPVPLREGVLNMFYGDGDRRSIHWKDGAFTIKGMSPPPRREELLAWSKQKPFLFSPNVLLRPVYQDTLLPTVATVAGPGEIAYFAQLKGVYGEFRLPMPIIYPRKSLTIVEKNIGSLLKKYHLDVPELWRNVARLIGDMTREQIPESVDRALAHIADEVERGFESLEREVMGFEPDLKASLNQAKGKMARQWKFMEKKIHQAATKHNEAAVRQLRKTVNHLYPDQHLQERVYNIVPYLIKYGFGFMDRLNQAVDIGGHGHQIVFL